MRKQINRILNLKPTVPSLPMVVHETKDKLTVESHDMIDIVKDMIPLENVVINTIDTMLNPMNQD